MEKRVFNFRTYYYLPWRGVQAAVLLLGGGALMATHHLLLGPLVILLGILVMTTHYGITIDLPNHTYQDYLSVLWIQSGEIKKFEAIEYVFIKPARVSQTMNSLTTSKKFTSDTFDGYIRFNEHEKVFLLTNEKKKVVLDKLQEIATALQIDVVDHSNEL
jgi:hypothetical protein